MRNRVFKNPSKYSEKKEYFICLHFLNREILELPVLFFYKLKITKFIIVNLLNEFHEAKIHLQLRTFFLELRKLLRKFTKKIKSRAFLTTVCILSR